MSNPFDDAVMRALQSGERPDPFHFSGCSPAVRHMAENWTFPSSDDPAGPAGASPLPSYRPLNNRELAALNSLRDILAA